MRTALSTGLMARMVVMALMAATTTASAETPLPARGDHSVYDVASVIDAQTEAHLEALDTLLMQKAGVAMVIVTVPRLDGETIEQLAVRVQHDWGVGASATDESIVIALTVEDRKIFIATGYGSEGYLPDGKVGELRDRARSKLSAGDFSGGLAQLANEAAAIAAAAHDVTLTGDPPPARAPSEDTGCAGSSTIVGFLVLFLVLSMFGRRGGGGGGGFLAGAMLGSMFNRRGSAGDGFGSSGSGGGGFGGFGGGSGGGGGAGGDF